MKVFNAISLCVFAISMVSCASHSTMRGSVVMKMSPDTAHVCMGDAEVKEGDKVAAFKHICKNGQDINTRSKLNPVCTKEKIGNGVVIKTLNDHYSEVKFDAGVPFEEGTTVERE